MLRASEGQQYPENLNLKNLLATTDGRQEEIARDIKNEMRLH